MEDKNVQKLLDMLYGMIDEARGATFSSEKCIINREEALDLLDEVRTKLPAELSKAQDLMKSKEQYVDKANREVKRMLDQAQDEAKRLREENGWHYRIMIDGSCNKKTFKRLYDAGAETFILGTSGLFSLDADLAAAYDKMKGQFEEETGLKQ